MCVLSVKENCDIVPTHGTNVNSSNVVSIRRCLDVVEMTQICMCTCVDNGPSGQVASMWRCCCIQCTPSSLVSIAVPCP